jgi:hypothetical protein
VQFARLQHLQISAFYGNWDDRGKRVSSLDALPHGLSRIKGGLGVENGFELQFINTHIFLRIFLTVKHRFFLILSQI